MNRFQVNTTLTSFENDLVWQYPDGKERDGSQSPRHHYPEIYVSCRFCEHCGAEIYAYWLKMDYAQSINDIYDEYKDSENRKTYHNYWTLRKSFDENIKNIYKDEANAFKEMKKCPVCGGDLLNDEGHFYSKSYFSSFSDISPEIGKLMGVKEKKTDDWWFYYDYKALTREESKKCINIAIDPLFVEMAEKRKVLDSESAVILAEQFVASVEGIESSMDIAAMSAAKFEGSLDNLKEYILHLITMENNIYALTKRLTVLYAQRFEIDRDLRKIKGAPLVNHIVEQYDNFYKEKDNAIIQEEELIKELEEKEHKIESNKQELVGLKSQKEAGYTEAYPTEPKLPVFKKVGIFNKASAIAENDRLQLEYENAFKKYERDIADYEKYKRSFEITIDEKIERKMTRIRDLQNDINVIEAKIKSLHNRRNEPAKVDTTDISLSSDALICPEMAVKDLLDKEIALAEDLLKKTIEERRRLYNMNIIFGKYRNVVALSTFYEYLMAGRCTSLDGANGAYNIYEAECRADIIVSQLSRVIELLEEIRDTQYMICSALSSINSSLGTLNHTMSTATESIKKIEVNTSNSNEYLSHISRNSDVIAYNTAATAYYSKKTAELTNSLGYMIAFSN